jgi:L-asparaginase II
MALAEGGRVVRAWGDTSRPVFYRSASKPLQALEVVLSGAADAFGLSEEEVAIAAGSHNGEPRHVAAVRSMLAKSGVPEAALGCGGHPSVIPEIAWAQRRDGVPVTAILSNCSGKHAGMLASARARGAPLEGYMEVSHPVQQAIVGWVASLAGLPREQVLAGVDGCGAPALAVPLAAVAASIARFGAAESEDGALAAACRRVRDAAVRHPGMVAGLERFDTDLMEAAEGRVVAKAGAEGVHVTAVPHLRLGLAVKADDGSDRGYRAVVVEALRSLGVLGEEAARRLRAKHAPETILNLAGRAVGRLEVVARL